MTAARHLRLLALGVFVWFAFWVAGLPDYYQQYSPAVLGSGCVLLSTAISLLALRALTRGRPGLRRARAIWISFYFTVPFAALDALYCGFYLGHGLAFLERYWYLTVFYISPWLTFLPTALLLERAAQQSVTNVR